MKKERNISMDVMRCCALFFVISVHFFLRTGYYDTYIPSKHMFLAEIIRSFFMICVPLFLILSGYLMNKKKLNKAYYKGIIKTLWIYVFASIACVIYKNIALDAHISFTKLISGILDFSSANYSWYIEMYIGLFLLIPFLNLIYNNLENKREKMVLIVTLLFLTSLPCILNSFDITAKSFWVKPSTSSEYNKILPSFWKSLYPITYYFIGCFLHEYPIRMKKGYNLLLLFAATFLSGVFNYYRSYGSIFIWGPWQEWGSLSIVVPSFLFFNLVSNIDFSKFNNLFKKIVTHISNCALGGYLVSSIFDSIFYGMLNKNVLIFASKLKYYIILVPIIFTCSILLSDVLNHIYDMMMYFYNKVKKKFISE